jgi:hypothetical protein
VTVLSNGEKFRVDLARRLLEGGELVACDEFTSVVDRQVAKIGAHAVQKFIRRADRRFVAATCHHDVNGTAPSRLFPQCLPVAGAILEEWLQPDWVLEPATMQFRWRSLQRRPALNCTIRRALDNWPLRRTMRLPRSPRVSSLGGAGTFALGCRST